MMFKVSLKRALIALLVMSAIGAGTVIAANNQPAPAAAVVTGEAPELGRMGTLAVGTSVVQYTLPTRAKITMVGAVTGRLPTADRTLSVRFWYPSSASANLPRTSYRHEIKTKGKPTFVVNTAGVGVENGAPLSGQKYPLVILSHGYSSWASNFSNLAENLASKGYVVGAIDHDDASFDSVTSFQMSFGNVMLDRSQDQRQIIQQIIGQSIAGASGLNAIIDPERIGLLGYSMGGFGALATAGAPYDQASKTIKQLPGQAQQAMASTSGPANNIKALILVAPWGGQPDSRSWTAADLAKITAPVLMIAGNQDDVVDFNHGVSWLFDNMTGADRRLLVYREARHNIVTNPVPIDASADFTALEFVAEPVWRSERLNQINQHFITAFLDLNLKGDAPKAAFLNVPTPIAAQGTWTTALGEQTGGKFAGDQQPGYWRGFQRRWALGLELHTAPKGSAIKIEPAVKP